MSEKIENEPKDNNSTVDIDARRGRAAYYFEEVLHNQRDWYSKNAGIQKARHLQLAFLVILLGVTISAIQALNLNTKLITAILGAGVALARGLDGLLRPAETWQGYRKASEGMKREQRLYVMNAEVYAAAASEDEAFQLLVERVEAIIAEEQQLFWQVRKQERTQEEQSRHEDRQTSHPTRTSR